MFEPRHRDQCCTPSIRVCALTLCLGWLALSGQAAETGTPEIQSKGTYPDVTLTNGVGAPAVISNLSGLNLSGSNHIAGKISGRPSDLYAQVEGLSPGMVQPSIGGKYYWWHRLSEGGYQVPLGANMNTSKAFTATPLSYQDEHNFLGLGLGGTSVKMKSAVADNSTMDPHLLQSGLVYRRFLNGPEAFLSPYLSAGANLQTLVRDYRDSVAAPQTGNPNDSWGMDGYAGLGLAFGNYRRLNFFGEADVGGTSPLLQNNQRFNAGVLGNAGYMGMKAGLNLHF